MTVAAPKYIPPHLQGRVNDFRNEENGMISFEDKQAMGGIDPHLSRVHITPEQYKNTFDYKTRHGYLPETAEKGYKGPFDPVSGMDRMQQGIGGLLRRAFDWGTESQGKAVGTAGIMSALGGAGAGYLLGDYFGSGSKMKKALVGAILAGGLGAAGTALSQRSFNKRQDYMAKRAAAFSPVSNAIHMAIDNDRSLDYRDKEDLREVVERLDRRDRDDLYRLLRQTIGAGAGVIIIRFLGLKGLIPSVAGGILGAALSTPPMRLNAMGQVSTNNFF